MTQWDTSSGMTASQLIFISENVIGDCSNTTDTEYGAYVWQYLTPLSVKTFYCFSVIANTADVDYSVDAPLWGWFSSFW